MKKAFIASLAGLVGAVAAQAQSFVDLKFEGAIINYVGDPDDPNLVFAADALPSWNVYYNGVSQSEIEYDALSGGATSVALVSAMNPIISAIDGDYSVVLQAFAPGAVATISQTGLIPSGTQTLLFKAQPSTGPLQVTVGTQVVPFTAVGTGANYTLYSANISAWAGDTEPLTFSDFGGTPNTWNIDDISFSTVPEPGIGALTAISGLLLAARNWFARNK